MTEKAKPLLMEKQAGVFRRRGEDKRANLINERLLLL
jgi:hypothetical protein